MMKDEDKTKEQLTEELAELRSKLAHAESARSRQVEKELQEAEERCKAVIDQSGDGIALVRDGRHAYVNGRFLRIFGYDSADEVVGKTHGLIAYPDDLPVAAECYRMREPGEPVASRREFRGVRKNGSVIRVEASGTGISYLGERATLVCLRDLSDRTRADEALQESEAKYRAVVESSLVGVYVVQDGLFRFVNKRWCEMYGYAYDEVVDRLGPQDITASEDLDIMKENFRRRLSRELDSVEYELRAIRKDGKIITVSVLGSFMPYKGLPAISGTVIDITESKRAEAIQRRLNRQLQAVSDCNQAMMRAVDEQTLLDDVCRIICEKAGYRMAWVGYADDDHGRTVRPVAWAGTENGYLSHTPVTWADTDLGRGPTGSAVRSGRTACIQDFMVDNAVLPWRDRALERGYRSSIALPLKDENGRTFGALNIYSVEPDTFTPDEIRLLEDLAGDLAFGINVLRVRAKQRQAEEALEESEAKYRAIVENSLVGACIIQDGLFRYVNKRWCDIYGYEYDEVVDRINPLDTVHPEDRELAKANIERRLGGEVDSLGYEFRSLRKDGSIIYIKLLGGSMVYRGRPAATSTVIDITRERTLETQLLQSQKMEAVGTLAGGIAHDFNNILTVMMGYGTLLQAGLGEDNPMREYVDQLLSSTEKAAQLTHGLLAFSRKQPVTLKPVSLNSVVRNTKKLLKRLLREDIEFRVRLGHDDITIVGDASQVDQILFNLASNARDAMPNGGILTIETKRIDLDGAFQDVHGYGKPGAYALISITDTGVGMDRATKEHIFDPFFTTKEAGVGTGLGLSTIYGIVRQHGGYINVYSEPQMGTTFHIYLPLADRAGEEEDQVSMAAGGGDETILIAEDDDAVRGLIKSILVAHGYRIVEAVDGADAVEQLRKSKDVALAIFDSVMPRKNGREACAEALRIRPDLKIIFMSGYTRDVFFEEGIDGAKPDFIQKPISPSVLLAKVREVLDTRKPG